MAILDRLLKQAVTREASDIHLAPVTSYHQDQYSIDCFGEAVLSATDTENMALRILGNEGFIQLQELGKSIPPIDCLVWLIFVSIYTAIREIGIAARVIKTIIPDLDILGLPVVGSWLAIPAVSYWSPVRLAAVIDHSGRYDRYINKERACHIVTLEDPIEYIHRANGV